MGIHGEVCRDVRGGVDGGVFGGVYGVCMGLCPACCIVSVEDQDTAKGQLSWFTLTDTKTICRGEFKHCKHV